MQEGNVLIAINILSPTQAAMRHATCAPAFLLLLLLHAQMPSPVFNPARCRRPSSRPWPPCITTGTGLST
jgi:hypothetical protein